MKAKRARSAGVRNPGGNALISGVVTGVSLVFVLLGGRSGSPLLMLGLFPALLGGLKTSGLDS